ncbi:hypothetical protein, partial [Lonsdalea britannica]|uniref:hypothetical protein n=1 Tax=Lonsdalea britannica TaxID=1082704 RepID=UPI0026EA058C
MSPFSAGFCRLNPTAERGDLYLLNRCHFLATFQMLLSPVTCHLSPVTCHLSPVTHTHTHTHT